MTIPALDEDARRRHARRNALHTFLLIAGSGALAALIAYSVYGPARLAWAAVIGAAGVWMAGRVSPRMILELYKARALRPDELPDVHRIVRELATAASLPAVPHLYYVPSARRTASPRTRPVSDIEPPSAAHALAQARRVVLKGAQLLCLHGMPGSMAPVL
jgi:hypothetical protein